MHNAGPFECAGERAGSVHANACAAGLMPPRAHIQCMLRRTSEAGAIALHEAKHTSRLYNDSAGYLNFIKIHSCNHGAITTRGAQLCAITGILNKIFATSATKSYEAAHFRCFFCSV